MTMVAPPRCARLFALRWTLSLVPCTATVSGAAGHNRGGVAETPLLERTQGRTAGCTASSTTYCCRVVFLCLVAE